MPLINFGSILNFAEELEQGDYDFYSILMQNSECIQDKEIYEKFSTDAKKNVKTVQRARRENVTEMILEPIVDFTRASYTIEYGNGKTSSKEFPLDGLGENKEFINLLKNNRINSIHSKEATLDDVFINVTGKTLLNNV